MQRQGQNMLEDEQAVFSISLIAKMLHVHPQTLRFYERAGFVKPVRARGDTRLYSHQDIARLRLILHLTRDMGVNLAGVEIILRMQHQLEHLQDEIEYLRQLLMGNEQLHGAERVQTQALIKATPRKLVKVK
jgi:MerR family transcriptional regulator/heat shock protein HspR